MKKLLLLIVLSIFFFASCYPDEDQPGYDEPINVSYEKCTGITAMGNTDVCVRNVIITPTDPADMEEARRKAYAYIPDLQLRECSNLEIVWNNLQCVPISTTR